MVFSLNPASILGPEFYGFLLPWIFTFAIVYGLLIKLSLFGDKVNTKVSIALAFVIAFFVTGAAGPQLAAFFINLFGGASVYIAGIIVILLFMALLGYDYKNKMIYVVAVIIIGIFLFLGSTGSFVGYAVVSADVAVLAFWVVIIILAVYMVTHEEKEKAPAGK
ncbi:MAG: hypothetical protein AABX14_05350 [Candidatus Aenigmatarchaeota archaeon]